VDSPRLTNFDAVRAPARRVAQENIGFMKLPENAAQGAVMGPLGNFSALLTVPAAQALITLEKRR